MSETVMDIREQIERLRAADCAGAVVPMMNEAADALEQAQTDVEKWKKRTESLANFNPDWDMLEATQSSLREHMQRIEQLEAALRKAVTMAKMSDGTWDEDADGPALQAIESLLTGDSNPAPERQAQWIVELEPDVWIAAVEGDPGRTLRRENARRYNHPGGADIALQDARRYRPFENARVVPADAGRGKTDG